MEGYDNSSLIDPYQLLGVTISSTPQEIRQAYYNLALICHPDKGGSAKDMDIINSAYRYVKEQIEGIDFEVTYESLEEDFSKFCLDQEEQKPPTFMQIYDEITGFNTRFNEEFEANKDKMFSASLPGGYGHLMEYSSNQTDYETNTKNDTDNKIRHKFNKEIILYQQPESRSNNEHFYDYKKDYKNMESYTVESGSSNAYGMSDYCYAFTEPVQLPTTIKETSPPMATEENTIKDIDVNKEKKEDWDTFDEWEDAESCESDDSTNYSKRFSSM